MHKKFEINRTKIKGGCQSRRKVLAHNSKSDLPLAFYHLFFLIPVCPISKRVLVWPLNEDQEEFDMLY